MSLFDESYDSQDDAAGSMNQNAASMRDTFSQGKDAVNRGRNLAQQIKDHQSGGQSQQQDPGGFGRMNGPMPQQNSSPGSAGEHAGGGSGSDSGFSPSFGGSGRDSGPGAGPGSSSGSGSGSSGSFGGRPGPQNAGPGGSSSGGSLNVEAPSFGGGGVAGGSIGTGQSGLGASFGGGSATMTAGAAGGGASASAAAGAGAAEAGTAAAAAAGPGALIAVVAVVLVVILIFACISLMPAESSNQMLHINDGEALTAVGPGDDGMYSLDDLLGYDLTSDEERAAFMKEVDKATPKILEIYSSALDSAKEDAKSSAESKLAAEGFDPEIDEVNYVWNDPPSGSAYTGSGASEKFTDEDPDAAALATICAYSVSVHNLVGGDENVETEMHEDEDGKETMGLTQVEGGNKSVFNSKSAIDDMLEKLKSAASGTTGTAAAGNAIYSANISITKEEKEGTRPVEPEEDETDPEGEDSGEGPGGSGETGGTTPGGGTGGGSHSGSTGGTGGTGGSSHSGGSAAGDDGEGPGGSGESHSGSTPGVDDGEGPGGSGERISLSPVQPIDTDGFIGPPAPPAPDTDTDTGDPEDPDSSEGEPEMETYTYYEYTVTITMSRADVSTICGKAFGYDPNSPYENDVMEYYMTEEDLSSSSSGEDETGTGDSSSDSSDSSADGSSSAETGSGDEDDSEEGAGGSGENAAEIRSSTPSVKPVSLSASSLSSGNISRTSASAGAGPVALAASVPGDESEDPDTDPDTDPETPGSTGGRVIDVSRPLFVGHSLVYGLEQTAKSRPSAMPADFLDEVGLSFIKLPGSGIYEKLHNYSCDTVVIIMGTNDLDTMNCNQQYYTDHFNELFQKIREVNPDAYIAVCSIPPVYEPKVKTYKALSNNANIRVHNEYVKKVCQDAGLQLIDCSAFFGDELRPDWTSDGLHIAPGDVNQDWFEFIIDALKTGSNSTNWNSSGSTFADSGELSYTAHTVATYQDVINDMVTFTGRMILDKDLDFSDMESVDKMSSFTYKGEAQNGTLGGRYGSGGGSQIIAVALREAGGEGHLDEGEKYWSALGYTSYVHYCSCFISWCAMECGFGDRDGGLGIFPVSAGCEYQREWFDGRGEYFSADEPGYIPQPGDVAFFDGAQGKKDGMADHVGLVVSCDENGALIHTVEGNTSKPGGGYPATRGVWQKDRYPRWSSHYTSGKWIMGYGHPDYPAPVYSGGTGFGTDYNYDLNDDLSDVMIMARVILWENSATKYDQLMVGAVFLNNAINDGISFYDNLFALNGNRYACKDAVVEGEGTPTDEIIASAIQVMSGRFPAPSNLVGQSGFKNNGVVFDVSPPAYDWLDTEYYAVDKLPISDVDAYGQAAFKTPAEAKAIAGQLAGETAEQALEIAMGSGVSGPGLGGNLNNPDGTVNQEKIKALSDQLTTFVNGGGYRNSKWYTSPVNTLQYKQCTWWARGRGLEYTQTMSHTATIDEFITACTGNGGDYYASNLAAGKFAWGTDPKPNSLVCFRITKTEQKFGHIAYVEAVDYVNRVYYFSEAGSGNYWGGIKQKEFGGAYRSSHYGWYQPGIFIYLDEPLK